MPVVMPVHDESASAMGSPLGVPIRSCPRMRTEARRRCEDAGAVLSNPACVRLCSYAACRETHPMPSGERRVPCDMPSRGWCDGAGRGEWGMAVWRALAATTPASQLTVWSLTSYWVAEGGRGLSRRGAR